MNEQYCFDFEIEKCVQCHACEVACKALHQAEAGMNWRSVVGIWRGEYPEVISRTVSMSCMHCSVPVCASACPRDAITKRPEDGIVVVNTDRCIGCRACLLACPFGAPKFGSSGKMEKCDLCVDRLEQGKEPACVATCPAEALHFGPVGELAKNKSMKAAVDYLFTASTVKA